ncbi:nucleophile-disabled Lam16a mutant holds Laminariheptaose in A cyclical conformation [Fomitiporia mediterranea MF3/22]|uniref:nucleophile-disabled Lam16a mutant holds Laminariheptaose in A cyclical conformation n=1 Tax=Fomitiporia mediterranea (strain MF3/22) TaxID=694068 RepID=UPI0004409368|nr:nucleophile-disabled Lam16a mutant holds Laminariheptaose in A cyclical conformation [Fomitiporia mediterranea MF3/22]EJD00854.1 nucleophile-disabled Lam16a mutant holds Laminariheptaose in A cyclical conformation [Fomitiporia mediterranea MF3/22]
MLFPLLAVSLLSLTPCLVSGAFYSISDYFVGKGFLFGFEFEAIEDPTHGRVTYVDRHTALAENLTFARGDTFIMRADDKEVLSPTGPGRKSVRIRSRKTFTTHVVVFDIRHMPEGCGTWPAAWETLEADWPDSGEVDVVEGVNDESPNDSTLHTGPNCTMPENRTMTGIPVSNNCDVAVNFNQGCVVENDKPNSYGPEFNAAGGGWYVMERTDSFIRVFFWSREDPSVPWEIAWGAPFIDTDNYGTPVALFPDTECYIPSHFGPNNIIINLTLCGDWAGQDVIFQGAGCPGTCVDFVNNNPSAFTDAYWDFAAVRIYE